MDLLINENVPAAVLAALRGRGHDATWIRTTAPGSSDIEVLEIAQKENRNHLTFDKDFGELAFQLGLPHNVELGYFEYRCHHPCIYFVWLLMLWKAEMIGQAIFL